MAINQLNTANTFNEWLTATKSLITIANNLTDGTTLTANTLLKLTAPGTSLNVSNNSVLNTITSNTITTGNINVTFAGISLNVTSNAVFGNANVFGEMVVNRLTVLGTQTIATTSYTSLEATGYIRAGSYVYQAGANSTFAGNVLFSNTGTSIFTLGNVFIGKAVTITGNSSVGGDFSVTGNTSLGPYTELVTDLGNISTNQDLNLKTASVFKANLQASAMLTLINPPASGRAVTATIYVKNGVGGTALTLRGNTSAGAIGKLRYAYDTPPTLETAVNNVNILVAFTMDGGSNWYISAPVIGSNTV